MATFMDKLKNKAQQAVKEAVTDAVQNAGNKKERIVFDSMPATAEEFKKLPQAAMDTPFKTAAMTVLAFTYYPVDKEMSLEMLDFLKGPENVSPFERQFIRERLDDKVYKAFSYFAGATPENGYTPTKPYTITVIENPYSFDNENWAMLYVKSSGADNPRGIKLRKKPSTGEWFLNDIQCLSDIRVPVAEDPWA